MVTAERHNITKVMEDRAATISGHIVPITDWHAVTCAPNNVQVADRRWELLGASDALAARARRG